MTGENGDVSFAALMAGEYDDPVETPVAQEAETANRDEKGRFAAKVEEVVEEQPQQEPEKGKGNIPPAAIAASREKAREANAENEQLRRELAEMRGQMQAFMRQQPAAKPVEEKPAPDFWEDPSAFIQTALSPMQEAMRKQNEAISMRLAVKEYGRESVEAAYQALGSALQARDPSALAEYERLKQSGDLYEDIVQWHKRAEAMKTVGSDPNAWFEAEFEKRLSDPAVQAKLIERFQTAASTNRSAPITKLPPSLSRLPAGGNASAEEADMSDAGLFRHAMRG